MRVLVTGAGGFAGGYAARRLAGLGFDVLAHARNSEVQPPAESDAAARFEVVRGDLASDPLPRADAIVHAAATSIWHGITVDQMLSDNVAATQALVRHALDTGVSRFAFFSSVSAFGEISGDVIDETTPTRNPDAYGMTKLLGEALLADVAEAMPSLSIRLPAVIGPGSKRNWLSECVRKLKAGEPLVYVNPDAPFNNAAHIADVTRLIADWLEGGRTGAGMALVAAGGDMPVRDVVARLAEGLGSKSEISVGTRPLRNFLIDCTRTQDAFGYAPMEIGPMLDRFISENLAP